MSGVGEDWDTQHVTWVRGGLGQSRVGLGQSRGGLGHCDNSSFVVECRVETSTDFATRVPDIHYPTGARVLVTVNLVSD